jgi:hypothetical protein
MQVEKKKAKEAVDALKDAFSKKAPQKPQKQFTEGRRLATMPRGQDKELRLTWDEFEGKAYLSLRVWVRKESGENASLETWIATKQGVSIRLQELPALIGSLVDLTDTVREYMESEAR